MRIVEERQVGGCSATGSVGALVIADCVGSHSPPVIMPMNWIVNSMQRVCLRYTHEAFEG